MSGKESKPSFASRTTRQYAVPIVLFWVVITAILNVVVPQLEAAGKANSVSISPSDAPSLRAMKHIGQVFKEFDSDSAAMIVLEGDRPLDDGAHRFYDELIKKLDRDTKHITHVQDFWGDPLTAGGAQSVDGKAAYVQVFLAGDQGESLANESVDAVKHIVDNTPAPPGVKAYVTGPVVLVADMNESGDRSILLITVVTGLVIMAMLLLVFRSVVTMILALVMVGLELSSARGVVAFLAHFNVIGLSTFAVNLIVALAMAAGTDYAIFLIGRYQEARQAGEDVETAYHTMYGGTAHVILGSGLTIAGAAFCLSFTRLPYFQTMGVPLATGMVVVVVVALTMGAGMIAIGSRFGLFEPKRMIKSRGWRRAGVAVVRWPGLILAATCVISVVGLIALPGYQQNYNDKNYVPAEIPANVGYAAADRHFSPARMNPELLLVETDHDLRNPADMLIIDKIAKYVFHVPGIARVQTITRPLGSPIEHTSLPFQISMMGVTQFENMSYMKERMADMLKMSDGMQRMIDSMEKMSALLRKLNGTTQSIVGKTRQTATQTKELKSYVADLKKFFGPERDGSSAEPQCFSASDCSQLRSMLASLDTVDALSNNLAGLTGDMGNLKHAMPQMLTLLPPMIGTMKTMRTTMLKMHSTFSGLMDQMGAMQNDATAMGRAFDAAKNDDTFYLPPDVFKNPDFKRGLKMFVSPDGKAVRFIISHEGDPASAEGISHVDAIKSAAKEAIKGTPLQGAKIELAGTAATYKDMRDGSTWDLMIAGISALTLIFIIMLIITRSIIAAATIVGTVVVSLGTSIGLSVLIWQHILGIELHWMVLAMSLIILLAVGSDYNLLLVSRFKEEIGAGLNTGIIRAMAGSGSVVTSAGLVFAFTMGSMLVGDLRIIGQIGTTICLGLLFDTLVVRAFMTPSIAALLGRWFWWPQNVRTRPASPLRRTPA
ncbi:RND family transporter [Mycobacterium sp.]|uniref:MMPL/RND family transporter n=1 Tax=Mycobacterium sp. TaxID=1785 RepID=UPI003BA9B5EA